MSTERTIAIKRGDIVAACEHMAASNGTMAEFWFSGWERGAVRVRVAGKRFFPLHVVICMSCQIASDGDQEKVRSKLRIAREWPMDAEVKGREVR